MLVVDLEQKKLYEDEELMGLFDVDPIYAKLIEDTPLVPADVKKLEAESLTALQRGFGYSREDVRMILQPMAADGKDAVWSMGDDTPLAFLARTPRPLYAYFRQRFAQVTNRPIDSLRESVVVSLHTRLGPWPHLLDKNAPLPGVSLPSPFLSLGQVESLRRGEYPHASELPLSELPCVFDPKLTLLQALDDLCQQSIDLVRNGARMLLLSDRQASPEKLPMPIAMATGAIHQALVAAGIRTLTGIAVEAGDCRDIHHAAVHWLWCGRGLPVAGIGDGARRCSYRR